MSASNVTDGIVVSIASMNQIVEKFATEENHSSGWVQPKKKAILFTPDAFLQHSCLLNEIIQQSEQERDAKFTIGWLVVPLKVTF